MKPVSDARPLEAAKKWSFGQGQATGRINLCAPHPCSGNHCDFTESTQTDRSRSKRLPENLIHNRPRFI